MIDRRVRVVSKTAWVLAGIAILFVACMEVGWAVPNAAGKPTSQTPALDPTVPVWLIFVDDLHLDFPATGRLKDLFKFDVGPGTTSDTSRENPFLAGGNEVSLARLRAEVAELTRQATGSNVPIFGIDPRGLSGLPTVQPNVSDAVWQGYWRTTRTSLQVISEQTGGRLIQDDLDGNLKRIVSTMR